MTDGAAGKTALRASGGEFAEYARLADAIQLRLTRCGQRSWFGVLAEIETAHQSGLEAMAREYAAALGAPAADVLDALPLAIETTLRAATLCRRVIGRNGYLVYLGTRYLGTVALERGGAAWVAEDDSGRDYRARLRTDATAALRAAAAPEYPAPPY